MARAAAVEGSSTASTTWSGTRPPTRPWRRRLQHASHRRAVRNQQFLQQRLGLTPSFDAPLFGVVARLTSQKGLDLLLGALPYLVAEGAQIGVLGTGEATIELGFAEAQRAYEGAVGCVFGYNEQLAQLIQGGSDFLVVPSRFEPCGLTQLCALRYIFAFSPRLGQKLP